MTAMVTKSVRTAYQRTHKPIAMREALCTETRTDNGFCVACGRHSGRDYIRSGHRPNRHGAFGYIETYGDGSTFTTPPDVETAD